MSAFSPQADVKMAKMLGDALRLLSKKYPDEEFPTIKDDDPNSFLDGGYLCIEGKNILGAVLLGDLWEELSKKNKPMSLPVPADCPAGFRISTVAWWPKKSEADGVMGYAADKQADTLADIAFTRLMYLNTKKAAKQHGDLLTGAAVDEPEPDPMDVEMEDIETGIQAPALENILPSAWLEDKKYRLTRDWRKWPSAGILNHEVSNLQQAQYGVTADVVFEAIKVEVAKARTKTSKAIMGETSEDAIALANDQSAAAVYGPLLKAYLSDKSAKGRLYKGASKNVATEVEKFIQWCHDHKADHDVVYIDDDGEQHDLLQDLDNLSVGALPSFYVRACKAYSQMENEGTFNGSAISAMDESAVTPSLAGDASLIGADTGLDDSIEAAPVPPTVPAPADGTPGPARGRGAARGRGRGHGRGGRVQPAAGSSRGGGRGGASGGASGGNLGTGAGKKRDRNDDDNEEDDLASLGGPVPKR